MKRAVLNYTCMLLALQLVPKASVAQQTAPADGPTIAVTMQFIQDKLKEFGNYQYTQYNQGSPVAQSTESVAKVSVDPANCTIQIEDVDLTIFKNSGAGIRETYSSTIFLRYATSVSSPKPQADNNGVLIDNRPTVYEVWMHGSDGISKTRTSHQESRNGMKYEKPSVKVTSGPGYVFNFLDRDIAERVANALHHAVVLCAPPPPPIVDTRKKPGDPF